MLTTKNRVGKSYIIFLALVTCLAGCTPPGPRALLAGKRLLEHGDYAKAIDQLSKAATLMKTNAVAWSYLGLACQQAGQTEEAEKAYLQALTFDRDLAEAHYNLGCLWLAQNRPDAAKNALTAFTLRRSDHVDGFLKLGTAHLRLREVAAAERSFAEALRLSPQHPEALNGLGMARVQRGQYRDAMLFFAGALKQKPDYRPALLNQAMVAHFYLRDKPLALQKYQAYLALKPTPPDADAVASLARQLERELAPPPRPAVAAAPPAVTNVAVVTNVPRPAPTSTPPARVATAPKPEPVTTVSSKPAPPVAAVTNQPKPAPAPVVAQAPPTTKAEAPKPTKVEAVRLPPEPIVKPARETTTVTPPAHASVQSAPATSGPPVRPAPQQVSATPPPAQGSGQSQVSTSAPPATAANSKGGAKKGLLHNINPLNLLRTEEKPAPRLTPLPTLPSAEPAVAAANSSSNTTPPPPMPNVPRYAYKSPPKPEPGNRASAERSFAQAFQAQEAKKYAEAIQAYQAASQADPSFFEAYYNLGLVSTAGGKLSVALTAYEMALAIQPDSVDTRYNFGLVLQQAHYPLDAANELEKVLTRHPNDVRVHLVLANLYAQSLRQTAKAREHYTRVLELDARHSQANAIRYWLAANPP